MPVFQFRLAPVLRLRERIKEEKEFELRALNLKRTRLEEEIRDLMARGESIGAAFAEAEGRLIEPSELKLQDEYARLLDKQVEGKSAALVSLRAPLTEKQQELIEAAREVKSLEILRERLAEKFRHGQNVEEQKFLDELGQRKFRRQ